MKGNTYLKRPVDFARVHRQGKYLSHPLLVLKNLPNGLTYSRWGVAAGKKLGTAVVRNRIKRRLREILRQVTLGTGKDIVIIARSGARAADFGDLRQAVVILLEKGGLIRTDEITRPGSN